MLVANWNLSFYVKFKSQHETIICNQIGRAGTRLPQSWSDKIKDMTGFEIPELVTDAPRGEVIKTKFEKYFPEASKIPGSGYILKLLPSYGGDWEQYYEIRMEWKK